MTITAARPLRAVPPPPLIEEPSLHSWPCYRCGIRRQVRERKRGFICIDCKWADREGVTMLLAQLPKEEGGTMSRNAFALDQLISEVRAAKGDDVEVQLGEPDGFDVVREVRFDAATSKWLAPLLTEPDSGESMDPRIARAEVVNRRLTVTFQGDSPRADDRTEFGLERANAILSPEEKPKDS